MHHTSHILYKPTDKNIPWQLKDSAGNIKTSTCKFCGRSGESLILPCTLDAAAIFHFLKENLELDTTQSTSGFPQEGSHTIIHKITLSLRHPETGEKVEIDHDTIEVDVP